jgi:predicted enzyme related to lactoylglutathione lyase
LIKHVATTSIFVSDQDRALDFYTNKLGFEKRSDAPMGPDAPRWLEVAPPGSQTAIVLFKATPEMPGCEDAAARIGQMASFIFHVDDMEATHRELTARGVEFVEAPKQEFWGWGAMIKDQDGNQIGLHG